MSTAEATIHAHRPATPLERLVSPAGLLLSAVMVVALIPVTGIIRDPDFWWHLRAGQLITQHGSLLQTDPFTYTVPGHAWTMHEWLTEIIFAALQRVAGLGAIVLLLSAVTWLGLVFVMQRSRLRASAFAVAAAIVLAALAGAPIWGPRAQMITFCFSALTLLLLERHLVRGGRSVWFLPPLFILWSNLHSGFIIGLGFIALVLVAELAGSRLGLPEGAERSRVRTLLPLLLVCAAASMLNPNGPAILLYAFQTQGSGAQQSLILEWHSPDFHQWALLPFGFMLLTLIALIVVNRRLRARDAALVIVSTALALQSVRHIALFIAATAPVWAEQASLLVERRRGPRRDRTLPPLGVQVAVYAALVAVLLAGYAGGRLLPSLLTRPGALVYAQEFPVCAARWLAQAPQPLNIFNQYGEGGYLADQLSPRGDRVFIFGDAALMGDALLERYAKVEAVQPGWDSIIRSADTDLVLFDSGTPLANVMLQSSRWVRVYQDPVSVAFVPAEKLHTLRLAPRPQRYAQSDPCSQLKPSPDTSGAQA